MNEQVWMFVVAALLVILAVIAYNIYQENQYRRSVRDQFGHSDKDALMQSQTESVRDGKTHGAQADKPLRSMDISAHAAAGSTHSGDTGQGSTRDLFSHAEETPDAGAAEQAPPDIEMEIETENAQAASVLQAEEAEQARYTFERVEAPVHSQLQTAGKKKTLIDLDDMVKQDLSWFEPRFDYMAYVALREPQELHALPRFSSRHRFQIAGCTLDDRWQIAEPIPSVYYQGFIIGLQAISRNGLATVQELEAFGSQVNGFAEKLDAAMNLMDIQAFLRTARPLDELCERVDQTIAMHLVSRNHISGTQLRASLEAAGFELSNDGAFHLLGDNGEPLFSIVTVDGSAFTAGLLANQAYRGFSMLFDVPHVPAGEKYFNRFMDLAVRLSSELGLDLVNDKLEELSTEWLKEVRRYVLMRQEEMQKVGIEPGSELAGRLFS